MKENQRTLSFILSQCCDAVEVTKELVQMYNDLSKSFFFPIHFCCLFSSVRWFPKSADEMSANENDERETSEKEDDSILLNTVYIDSSNLTKIAFAPLARFRIDGGGRAGSVTGPKFWSVFLLYVSPR
jgi:hypothetical protein